MQPQFSTPNYHGYRNKAWYKYPSTTIKNLSIVYHLLTKLLDHHDILKEKSQQTGSTLPWNSTGKVSLDQTSYKADSVEETLFVVFVYLKPWFRAHSVKSAASNDITLFR